MEEDEGDNRVPTAATNGSIFKVNPDFLKGLTYRDMKFLWAHEVLHCALLHHIRMMDSPPKDPEIWNVAADLVVNRLLSDAGIAPDMDVPNNDYWSMHQHKDMTVEEVYATLMKDRPKPPPSGSGDGDGDGDKEGKHNPFGEIEPPPDDQDQAEQERKWKEQVSQAENFQKRHGSMPGELEELINEILRPKVDWRSILRDYFEEASKGDYTWTAPNRRYYASLGVYLPSITTDNDGTVVVGVDTSGSVTQKEMDQFAAEVQDIRDQFPVRVIVIYCSSRIHHVDVFEKEEAVTIKRHGTGGTNFNPVFDLVEKDDMNPSCLVYLTDCWGTYPRLEPSYPVIWGSTSPKKELSGGYFPPFGKFVELDLDK